MHVPHLVISDASPNDDSRRVLQARRLIGDFVVPQQRRMPLEKAGAFLGRRRSECRSVADEGMLWMSHRMGNAYLSSQPRENYALPSLKSGNLQRDKIQIER